MSWEKRREGNKGNLRLVTYLLIHHMVVKSYTVLGAGITEMERKTGSLRDASVMEKSDE